MKQEIEQIIKNNLPEKKENPKNKCINAENHLFGRCFSCEKNNGFNDCLAQINTSLIADEVLKVVVGKIEMLYGDIVTTKKDIAIPHNCIEYETALDDVVNLLSNLSPNKENK